MKLKTTNGVYTIADANHKDGSLHVNFGSEKTCEELQAIFSDKDSIARLEILTDDEVPTSVITGYVVLERVELEQNEKTVVLGKEIDAIEKRITQVATGLAENVEQTGTNTNSIEKQRADLDYMAMQMEVTLDE